MSEMRRYQVWWRASGDIIVRASNPEEARATVSRVVTETLRDEDITPNHVSIEGCTVEPEETNP